MNRRPLARLSIQWKLPLVVGGLLLTFTAALSWAAYDYVRTSTMNAEQERLPRIVAQLVAGVESSFRQLQRRLHVRAADPSVHAYLHSRSARDQAAALAATLAPARADTTTVAVEIWDAARQQLVTQGLPPSVLSRLSSHDVLAADPGDDSAAVGRLQALGDTLLYPVVALVAEGGERLGYLVQWRRVIPNPRSLKSIAGLIEPDVRLFVGSMKGAWTDQVHIVDPPPIDVSAVKGLARYLRPGAGRQVAAAAVVPGSSWQILLELPEASVLAAPRRFLGEIAAIAALLLAAGLAVFWNFSRRLTRPLRDLTAAIDARSSGARMVPVRVEREDELGRLASAFSRMADQVDHEAAARTASEQQWRQLFDNSPLPMFVYDIQTLEFLAVNDAAELQYGYSREEFLGMTITDVIVPGEVPLALETIERIRRGVDPEHSWHHRKKDGTVMDVETHSHPLSFGQRPARLVLVDDVTMRKSLEAQLRQAQKMEAIGQLAAGVAHDFNNVLTAISGNAELVQETLDPEDSRREEMEEILRASKRAGSLTRQLLAFGRRQVLLPTVLDLNETVTATEKMLSRLIGANIEAVWLLDPDLHAVKLDPGQMEQVILNLAVNARDAMERGGKLTVETRNVTLDDAGAQARGLSISGNYVMMSVSDTGAGMSREVQSHVFEPFFTTKAQGKGTGLGLSTVYGIVTQSGGSILVYSEPGVGTTFKLYFPATTESPSSMVAEEEPEPITQSATILLVEDEAPVRKFAATALTRAGYHVLVAEDAAEALQIAGGLNGSLDLLLTDVVMPGMSGRELGELLLQSKPKLKVLFMSGYSGEAVVRHGVLPRGTALLEKPFSTSALLSQVGVSLLGHV